MRERERENFNEYVLKLIGEVSNDIELADESDVKLFLKKKKKDRICCEIGQLSFWFHDWEGPRFLGQNNTYP